MIEYLYFSEGKYNHGKGTEYIVPNPKKKSFLSIFISGHNPNEISKVCNDFSLEEKYFSKFKSEKRSENQLSTKLVNRVVQISTRPGDIVLDPFGGSGTTFDVCERNNRHWIGIEQESCDAIIERLTTPIVCSHAHDDFVED